MPNDSLKELPPEPPFTPGKYRHYRGNFYHAITLALKESDLSWQVIYRPLWMPEGTLWIRPYDEFFQNLGQKGACILTGQEGENEDDCTTHDHEEDESLPRFLLTEADHKPWKY